MQHFYMEMCVHSHIEEKIVISFFLLFQNAIFNENTDEMVVVKDIEMFR
jgi:GTP cyclohydrolase I